MNVNKTKETNHDDSQNDVYDDDELRKERQEQITELLDSSIQ